MGTIRMSAEQKAKWLEALRSGKYEQGIGVLRSRGTPEDSVIRYCCLGVLQHVLDGEVEMTGAIPRGLPSAQWYLYKGISLRSNPTGDWLNLKDALGEELSGFSPFIGEGTTVLRDGEPVDMSGTTYAYLNDSGLCDFNTIANSLEKDIEVAE